MSEGVFDTHNRSILLADRWGGVGEASKETLPRREVCERISGRRIRARSPIRYEKEVANEPRQDAKGGLVLGPVGAMAGAATRSDKKQHRKNVEKLLKEQNELLKSLQGNVKNR